MVDAAIRLYRNNFSTLVRISAIVLVPIGIVQVLALVAIGPIDFRTLETIDPATTDAMDALLPILRQTFAASAVALLSPLGSIIVQGASIMALAQYFQGDEPDWRASLRVGARRFFPLFASTLLIGIVSGLGLVLCLVPGIFLFTMWSVSPAALITERKGPIQALGRSYQLVSGRFWPALGAIVLAYVLYWVANQVIGVVTGALTLFGSSEGVISLAPTQVGSVIASILTTPFIAAMITILYFDLRVRKEGYDLELMAADLAELEAEHPGTTPPASDDDPFGLGSPGER